MAASVLACMLTLAVTAPATTAADPAVHRPVASVGEARTNPLDDEVADAALLFSADPVADPRLLVVAAPLEGSSAGALDVRLLVRRLTGWELAARLGLAVSVPEAEPPWFVEVAPGRFALLAVSRSDPSTLVSLIEVDDVGVREIARATLPIDVDDAGAADVDGDGMRELVVARASTQPSGGLCQGSKLLVLDGQTLEQRHRWTIPDLRLAAGVLAELDDMPGDELAAYAFRNCPAGPDASARMTLVAVRLADGVVVADMGVAPDTPPAWSGLLQAGDLDGDGRVDLIARGGRELFAIEPARSWRKSSLGTGDILPISMHVDANRPGSSPTVVLVRPSEIEVARLVEGVNGLALDTVQSFEASVVPRPRWQRMLNAIRGIVLGQGPAVAWWSDIDGDDCTDLVLALTIVRCAGESDGAASPGPAWVATRPLAEVGREGRRRVLVAEAVGWQPGRGLRLPTPLASHRTTSGVWRHGPSTPFVLAEVSLADLGYFGRFPIPAPTMNRSTTSSPPAATVAGRTGARVLARFRPLAADAPAPGYAPTIEQFMGSPQLEGEHATLVRVAVPRGREAGIENAAASVALEPQAAGRWLVTVTVVNDWGEISEPVHEIVVRDVTGPGLVLHAPFVSPPWPFSSTIRGTTEPGAVVRAADGSVATASARGSFEIEARLAPWPQTLTLVAVDTAGNETYREFIVIGGIDYRRLPWEWMVAALVLLAVVASSVRDGRRGRGRAVRDVAQRRPHVPSSPDRHRYRGRRRHQFGWVAEPDVLPLPEFEEIEPGETS